MNERDTLVLNTEQGAAFAESIESLNRALDNARIAQQVAANEEASFARLCRALGIKPANFISYDRDSWTVTVRVEEADGATS